MSMLILGIFDYRMMLAMFIVVPLALPFALLSYKRMVHSSLDCRMHSKVHPLEFLNMWREYRR